MGFCGSVLSGNGDHATLGEVPALGIKLGGGSSYPTASEKEHDGWPTCFLGVVVWREDVEVEFDGLLFCVGGCLVQNPLRLSRLLGVQGV